MSTDGSAESTVKMSSSSSPPRSKLPDAFGVRLAGVEVDVDRRLRTLRVRDDGVAHVVRRGRRLAEHRAIQTPPEPP